jgi:acid phosphatase type 7
LDQDLAAAKEKGRHLVVAYHDPYFTSDTDEHTPAEEAKPWIDVIDKYDVRLTLSGSQHNYERSCPVLADGTCTPDTGTGTTAFQVSTGGIGLREFTSSPSYIVKRFSDTHGWLKLTLEDDGGFTWEFMPVAGPGTDSGRRPPAR